MFVKFNKEEIALFQKLTAAGNDIICRGEGYYFNDICFASYKDFWKFCESKV